MPLVDLHVHTTYSDGHNSPSEVVKMAAENGVAVIAVADHDNLEGIDEALAAGKKEGVAVVAGVEISTGFHGGRLHILGLGVDHQDAAFKSFLKKIYEHRKDAMVARLEVFNERLQAAGRPVVDLVDFVNCQGEYFNHEKTAYYLALKGFTDDPERVVKELFDIRVENEHTVNASQVIKAIHRAKGLAVMAHPFAMGTSLRKLDQTATGQEALLKELVETGIDGLEVYQSEHGPEEASFALELVKKYGLLASAGSDWHGAICDVPGDVTERKGFYPEHVGGLGVTTAMVAPLLARLGVPRGAEAKWGVGK